MSTQMQYVFVYGSLRRGMHADLSTEPGVKYIGTGTIVATLYPVRGMNFPFPTVVLGGENRVVGEVMKVTPDVMEALYKFEGVGMKPSRYWYADYGVDVTLLDGTKLIAHVFAWKEPYRNMRAIEHGDWVRYYAEQVEGDEA